MRAGEIERRFAWARRQGHPQYLWPETPVASWRASLRAIAHTTARVLKSAERPISLDIPRGSTARSLGIAAFTSGMGPLLGLWTESGTVAADARVQSLLRLHLLHARRRTTMLQARVSRILRDFAQCGVTATVLKGAHTAATYFPEPATRPVADIDLAVARSDVEPAYRALRAAGFVRSKRQSRPHKSTWVPVPTPRLRSLELTHAENPWAVEIHSSIDRDFFGVRTVRVGDLDRNSTMPWDGLHAPARALAQPFLLAYLALHASEEFHALQLIRLVELVWVTRTDVAAGRLAWDDVAFLLERAHALRFAFPAIELAERLVPETFDATLLTNLRAAATPSMRRVIADLGPGDAQRLDRLSVEERFMWARGPLETARRLARFFFPSGTDVRLRSLGSMQWTRLHRLFRGRVSLRRSREVPGTPTAPENAAEQGSSSPQPSSQGRQRLQTEPGSSTRSASRPPRQHPK